MNNNNCKGLHYIVFSISPSCSYFISPNFKCSYQKEEEWERVRNAYRVFVWKYEGRRALGRLIHRLEINIKIDHREVGWEDIDWIHLAQDMDEW
jgi:hypothetical protein